mmetsp:Transcript_52598/g.125618  ORF Transcript_52598/g.125618 Transcript_52598/m.125618 type:complete len:229 (+) Transcript_52598:80-766(+)
MADDSKGAQWLIDLVADVMRSPSWNEPLQIFIAEKCILFDNFQEENKHEYVEVFNAFKALIDDLLAAHLLEVDITPEEFEKQCVEGGLLEDPKLKEVMGPFMAAEDFVAFKNMMIDQHAAMQSQAEAAYKEAATEDNIAREELRAAQAASVAAQAAPKAAAAPVVRPAAPASSGGGGASVLPSAEQERAFGAAGGFYGRGAMPNTGKKASTEKASAIRKALASAMRPK